MLTYSTKMLQEIQLIQGQPDCYRPSGERRTVAIAPAPERGYLTQSHQNSQSSELMRCRKKINFKSNPYTGPQAVSIARRNARERNRVKQVNDGFAALRRHLPASVVAALSHGARRGAGKKLSKVDTLRMVVEYIRYLQQLLDDSDASMGIVRDPAENNENIVCNSPTSEMSRTEEGFGCSESPCASPAPSESSSGVSSGYSVPYGSLERYETPAPYPHPHSAHPHQLSPMEEDELLDVISWWQQK